MGVRVAGCRSGIVSTVHERWSSEEGWRFSGGVLELIQNNVRSCFAFSALAAECPRGDRKAAERRRRSNPRGRFWKQSTIRGNPKTGVGILNNQLYWAELIHGRQATDRNPKTGLRGKATMNPASALKMKQVDPPRDPRLTPGAVGAVRNDRSQRGARNEGPRPTRHRPGRADRSSYSRS